MLTDKACSHITGIKDIKQAEAYQCADCMRIGSDWVHLRTCQTCGITLCCDQSPNQHMTHHFHKTAHPVVVSSEPGEKWLWCYTDEMFAEYS